MRTRNRVALALVLAACWPDALPAQEPTEQQIVDAIVRDGPQARAIRAASDVVALEQAARLVFPNPTASYARESAGFTEFLQAEQRLPPFGVRKALERAGVAAREAAEAERDARLWQLRIDAHGGLARLCAAEERRQAAESLVKSVAQLGSVLATREQEGEGSRFDRVRAQQELIDARQLVVAAQVDVADARSAIAAMLPPGMPLPDAVPPPGGLRAMTAMESVDALAARAATGRAELRALSAAAERFSFEADVARRMTGIAPVVSGGLKRADDAGERRAGGVVGVGLTLPLFNRGTREAARWSADSERTQLERTALETAIRADIVRAAESIAIRRQASEAVAASLASADDLIAMADVAYREGEIGVLQLLDAYRTAGRARERAVDAKLNLRLAQIALERAVGVTLWP